MDQKVIEQVVAEITNRVITVEHAHMLRPWQMVLGGLILPALAEADPSFAEDAHYAELMARYDKEAVEKVFAAEAVKEVVERVVEVPVVKYVEVPGATAARKPTLHQTVKSAGKFRRLKATVAKVSRKRNDIPPEGRDLINKWWNTHQRLVKPGEECQAIADEINALNACKPLSASQVSGWLSWLCRLALKSQADLDNYIARALKVGKFTVIPKFDSQLQMEIANNKQRIAEERERATKAKRQMAAEAAQLTGAAQP